MADDSPLTPVLDERDIEEQTRERDFAYALNVDQSADVSDTPDSVADTDIEKAPSAAPATAPPPIDRNSTTAQDWCGPDDPENPHNWSHIKRAYHTFVVAFLSLAVTCGSSLITPAAPEIEQRFHTSRTVAILPLSLFAIGLGIGPTIAAPISETQGRRVVYLATTPVYMLFLLGSGFSDTLAGLLVCRLLAGCAGGPVLAVAVGTLADMYPPRLMGVAGSFFAVAPFLGPSLGPIIGGFVAQYKGWRWTQWVSIFIALVSYIFVLFSSETYKKTILLKRSKRLGLPPPPGTNVRGMALIKTILIMTVGRPLHMLMVEPTVICWSLYHLFSFGVLFAFFAAYPYTFETVYGFNTWQYGLAFIGVGIGVIISGALSLTLDQSIYVKKHEEVLKAGGTIVAPEHRLYLAMVGAFGIPVGLFWFGWSARKDVHWISPIIAGAVFAWGNLSIFRPGINYMLDLYGPLYGASAMAANGLTRYLGGAVFPLFTFQMYEALGIAWATSLLAFIGLALLPIPFVFFRFGPKIRNSSHYGVNKFS